MGSAVEREREESVYRSDSEDTDHVALSDTDESEYEEDAQWEMDEILAQADFDVEGKDGRIGRERHYLVKWTGYSQYKASWEPASHFSNFRDVLFFWQERHSQIERGAGHHFDIEAWEDKLVEIAAKKARRRARRNRRRRKEGLPEVAYPSARDGGYEDDENESPARTPSPSIAVDENYDEEESDTDGVDFTRRRRKSRTTVDSESDSDNARRVKKRKDGNPQPKARNAESAVTRNQTETQISQNLLPTITSQNSPIGPAAANRSDAVKNAFFNSSLSTQSTLRKTPPSAGAQLNIAPTTRAIRPLQPDVGARNPARSTVAGSEIFADFSGRGQTATRGRGMTSTDRRSRTGQGEFRNLSHRYHSQRKDAEEAIPELRNVDLIDPSTGKRVPAAQLARAPNDIHNLATELPLPRTLSSFQKEQPPETPSGKRASDAETLAANAAGSLAASNIQSPSSRRESIPKNQTAQDSPQALLQQQSRTREELTTEVPLTCYFWKVTGDCRHGSRCGLEHKDTGRMVERNISRDLITCPFWQYGHCSRGLDCMFAHTLTMYVAGNGGPVRRLRHDTGSHGPMFEVAPEDANMAGYPIGRSDLPKKSQSCWFWATSRCFKDENSCQFAHAKKEYVAGRGGDKPIPWSIVVPLDDSASTAPEKSVISHAPKESDVSMRQPSRSPSPLPRRTYGRGTEGISSFAFFNDSAKDLQKGSKLSMHQSVSKDSISLKLKIDGDVYAVGLSCDDVVSLGKFERTLATEAVLELDHSCVAETAIEFLDLEKHPVILAGDIAATSSVSSPILEALAETLRLHSAGAVHFGVHFTLVVYPKGQGVWSKISKRSNARETTILHCLVLSPDALPKPASAGMKLKNFGPGTLVSRLPQQFDLSGIFKMTDGADLERRAFLLFPPDKRSQEDDLRERLQTMGVTVYSNAMAGSWDYFRTQCPAGVVLIDSAFASFEKLRGLYALTYRHVNFFHYGPILRSPLYPSIHQDDISYSPQLVRLFPLGQAILILDRSYRDEPKDSLAVIKVAVDRFKRQRLVTRVLGRPDLLNWILHLADEEHRNDSTSLFHSEESSAFSTYMQIWHSLQTLLEEHAFSFERIASEKPKPSETFSPVFYLPHEDWPQYAEAARNGTEDEEAISWFAGWAITQAVNLRKFIVITVAPQREVQKWQARYNHLSFLSPVKFVERSKNSTAAKAGRKRATTTTTSKNDEKGMTK